ncbi:bifunctional phosphopantothenoylcysteine decarboxylase/phosphopantothenate--cysteine ligase CoaBC [Aquihabitans daechungensis]|uniref:bifunctional phosphopantothenoylcysteine decarboxylase/phosphopantothenate--cysteine ligase CoaBC n=1 Tax=Aquihabitans daechungensis TaxID=1052257 RepID=UPI003B9E9734
MGAPGGAGEPGHPAAPGRAHRRSEPGRLAGGDIGHGRLAEPSTIVAAAAAALTVPDLAGLRVLVTAGGTREPIDPVRFIGNRSSGKQGTAIAVAALRRGAAVTLVTTAAAPSLPGLEVVSVATAAELRAAVHERAPSCDVVVMAAAVADFRPASVAVDKIKKAGGVPEIRLEPTEDILAELGAAKAPGQTLVGFAAETTDVAANAQDKLARKGTDLLVANDVAAPSTGFEHDTNAVTIFSAAGAVDTVELASKALVADRVLDSVVSHRLMSSGSLNPQFPTK